MPVLFMFLAVGFCRLAPRLSKWVLPLFCLALLVNSTAAMVHPKARLGRHELYLFSLPTMINQYSAPDQNSLVLMNVRDRSSLFPLVNMLDPSFDIKILRQRNITEQVDQICTRFDFDNIIFVYLDVSYIDPWTNDVFTDFKACLQQYGYVLRQEFDQPYGDLSRTLWIFQKN